MITSKTLGLWKYRTLLPSETFTCRRSSFEKNVFNNARFCVSVQCLTNLPGKIKLVPGLCQISLRKFCLKFDPKELQEDDDDQIDSDGSDEILTEEVLKEVANGDPKIEKLLKVLEFEISIYREQQVPVPKVIRTKEWMELVSLSGIHQRRKYLEFLFKNEIERIKKAQQTIESRALRDIIEEFSPPKLGKYRLGGNSLLVRVYDKSINRILSEKLLAAMLFYHPVIFDFSYDSYMSRVNAKYCAKQLVQSYSLNRLHTAPLHIKCCNVNKQGVTYEFFENIINTCNEDNCLIDIHEESYLDLYPKEKLVYLTPHTHHEMKSFDPDKIYIIGAFVDKGLGVQASLAKAKAEGLEMAKFPLDRYLVWKSGGKSLPLNIVLQILLDVRLHKQWKIALKNIPDRNLKPSRLQEIYYKNRKPIIKV